MTEVLVYLRSSMRHYCKEFLFLNNLDLCGVLYGKSFISLLSKKSERKTRRLSK